MGIVSILMELEEKGLQNDAVQMDKSKKYLNITRDTGEFLRVLVRASGAGKILEIGTSNGYSTIWLASSVPAGGRVTTIEHSEVKSREARHNLKRAGLFEKVVLKQGDARALLQGMEEEYDLIFLDADRSKYMDMVKDILRLLKPGGLIVCDNAVSHASELSGFMEHIRSLKGFSTSLVPVGKGEFLAHKPVEAGTD
ncbi:O-methyltransferase [Desulfospira joergensenii]|uniref:O-methyltransferase n=1 Tax=Desulfospira joergensenii TaxID=53329 RepID=UPI0003B3FB5B|nr:O-methyltransferase [Desulfospira joergensenii]